VNNFVIKQGVIPTDKQINIPVQLSWDYLGLDLAIEEYETRIITEVIGVGRDFEVSRFSHAPATGTTDSTEVNYEFYFYSGGSLDDISNWRINYISEGFTPQEIYYYSNNFANSFFKLDLLPQKEKDILFSKSSNRRFIYLKNIFSHKNYRFSKKIKSTRSIKNGIYCVKS
jgi:hypothetical protein